MPSTASASWRARRNSPRGTSRSPGVHTCASGFPRLMTTQRPCALRANVNSTLPARTTAVRRSGATVTTLTSSIYTSRLGGL
ncbi:hypothetical protein D6833_03875 [Candidatus Parcubacteria bacterium]|nr:MAG: hypothetical protein D6833_03875 [Candidatus Parcubacteria bacterium]